jgi:hypothetical protein
MGHKKIKTLESLLKRPNLTIEELLDYELIIQKARNNDVGLSVYFQNGEHIKWLLDIFLKIDLPLERRIKYDHQANHFMLICLKDILLLLLK